MEFVAEGLKKHFSLIDQMKKINVNGESDYFLAGLFLLSALMEMRGDVLYSSPLYTNGRYQAELVLCGEFVFNGNS